MRAKEFLFEYNRAITAQKLGGTLMAKFRTEPKDWQQRVAGDVEKSQLQDILLSKLEAADPTRNKQYVPWLARTYINTPGLKFEDAVTRAHEPLSRFYQAVQRKKIPAPSNDIGRITSLEQLDQVVDQFAVTDEPQPERDKGSAKEYYRDADLRIIVPEDQTAACYYGQGTKWCTSARENNRYSQYAGRGPLYIIIPTKPQEPGEKFQFHFETKQFMDVKDQPVKLEELAQRYPQLRQIFAQQAKKHNVYQLTMNAEQIKYATSQLPNLLARQLPDRISQSYPAMLKDIAKVLENMDDYMKESIVNKARRDFLNIGPELTRLVVKASTDPFQILDADKRYDVLMDVVGDWLYNTNFYPMTMDAIEDGDFGDEDYVQDIGMSLNDAVLTNVHEIVGKTADEIIQSFAG